MILFDETSRALRCNDVRDGLRESVSVYFGKWKSAHLAPFAGTYLAIRPSRLAGSPSFTSFIGKAWEVHI